jgi:hypothetical protein
VINRTDYRGEWFYERPSFVANGRRKPIALVSMEVYSLGQRAAAPRGSQESHAIALRHRAGAAPVATPAPDDRTRSYAIAGIGVANTLAHGDHFA